ncbi:GNAT family N-acetyltransferase [Anseongella ginsenosidimutans]|nr:GNAT family N-acetyltransferase [Anseongella ginsenosidimutans]
MRKASYRDKTRVADILTRAFDANESVNYVIPRDSRRKQRIRALMNYSFDVCFAFGDVFLSHDGNACALVMYPDKKKTTLRSVFLDARLVCSGTGIRNIKKVLRRESLIKKTQPREPMYYLWFIGVEPGRQHRGAGSRLLRELIDHSEEMRRAMFLETSTRRNLPWYEQFGLKVYAELDLGYTLYFLRRQKASAATNTGRG